LKFDEVIQENLKETDIAETDPIIDEKGGLLKNQKKTGTIIMGISLGDV